ncbi:MAG: 5-(carboxyamino)imidazole ribonucleotide synthase [Alphaproteobacteria bacterium]
MPHSLARPLEPGATIGILGGGQLGRMLSLAAARLGFKTHIYSGEANACAFQTAHMRTNAAYEDTRALESFAKSVAAVTFEFENIPDAALSTLGAHVRVAPTVRSLAVAQDRLAERNFLAELGIATAPFRAIAADADVEAAFGAIGAPAVFKTCRLGYDGKGQKRVAKIEDVRAAFAGFGRAPAILEPSVDFAFEASVVAARGQDGAFAAYDSPENLHGEHILRRSSVPSRLTPAQSSDAAGIAKKIADALAHVGVLCVEFFVTKEGRLLVNEIAPRVHNSGHWTLDACLVSQFEQHIRAIAGWPLAQTSRHSDAVMENIIGEEVNEWLALASKPCGLHLYGKGEARPGRKMGHLTRLYPLGSLANK